MPPRFRTLVALATAVLVTSAARAESIVRFDHVKTPTNSSSLPQRLKHGERFRVVVTGTQTAHFDYTVIGIEIVAPEGSEGSTALTNDSTKELELEHDRKYGGYKVLVRRTSSTPAIVTLVDKEWFIPVETRQWDTAIAGGFTVSDLTNPVYDVRTEAGSSVVTRNREAEDDVALGLAGLVHVFHTDHPAVAGTFGLGVSDQSNTSYYLGMSWRWGDRGALTGGYMWGSVDRLPSGIREGDVVTDPNVLASPGKRMDGAVFIAVSFSFIGVGDLFEKPFAETPSKKEK